MLRRPDPGSRAFANRSTTVGIDGVPITEDTALFDIGLAVSLTKTPATASNNLANSRKTARRTW
ncbi:hypothetical protein C3941_18795 [Kaistia algarum]|nr:hypothetical protein C3941_18795 [Kaistia algarum]